MFSVTKLWEQVEYKERGERVITMRQVIDLNTELNQYEVYIQNLRYELDYELLSLHAALENKEEQAVQSSKRRLFEITNELQQYGEL